jgi:hypothetical protein
MIVAEWTKNTFCTIMGGNDDLYLQTLKMPQISKFSLCSAEKVIRIIIIYWGSNAVLICTLSIEGQWAIGGPLGPHMEIIEGPRALSHS